jgi:predicted nuclease of predicted toxin-antitoxin system
MKGWIDQAAASKLWLVFMFHQISDDQTQTLGITEADFTELVNYAAASNNDVITVSEGVALIP